MKKRFKIARCENYNGYKANFCIEADDERLNNADWVDLGPLVKVGKSWVATETGRVYQRAHDWSLKEITISK